jgi:hypothetical protein
MALLSVTVCFAEFWCQATSSARKQYWVFESSMNKRYHPFNLAKKKSLSLHRRRFGAASSMFLPLADRIFSYVLVEGSTFRNIAFLGVLIWMMVVGTINSVGFGKSDALGGTLRNSHTVQSIV